MPFALLFCHGPAGPSGRGGGGGEPAAIERLFCARGLDFVGK